jgi:ABC-type transport system involved in multi-copper enzyme maturation permease subunit
MLLGPVFVAEMVTTARRRRYMLMRVVFACALLFILWICCLGVRNGRMVGGPLSLSESSSLATAFFISFSWTTLIGTILVVPAIAAGTIATERDRRTIEYLFATDLSNAEIVLSKVFAKVLLVAKLLVVALPVIAIFRLLGGIPGDLLMAFYAILASTAVTLVMMSVSVSVWTTRARDALTRVYLLLAAILVLPTALLGLLSGLLAYNPGWSMVINPVVWLSTKLVEINPIWVYAGAMGGGGALGLSLDFAAIRYLVLAHLAISAVLATISVLAVRRVHLGALGKSARQRQVRRTRQVGNHPMLWKECFAKSASLKLGWIGRIALLLIMITTVGFAISGFVWTLYAGSSWQQPWEEFLGVCLTITCIYGSGMVLLVGVRAAGLISYEKERDCWLSLLATPLTASEIVGGKMVGNLFAFRWLPFPLVLVWILQLVLNPACIFAFGFTVVAITVTSLFASIVGLAFSLKFNTTLKAIGATLAVVLFVGGGYTLCCCLPIMIGGGGEEVMRLGFSLVIPFLLAIPGIAMTEGGNEIGWFVADFVIGVFAYGLATMVLYSTTCSSFDRIVGRSTERSINLAPTITV